MHRGGGGLKFCSRALPHALIIVSAMYTTFFIIDLINTAMHFIDNKYTIGLLVLYAVMTFCESFVFVRMTRKHTKKRVSAPIVLDAIAIAIFYIVIYNRVAPYSLFLSRQYVKTALMLFMVIVTTYSVLLIKRQREE